MADKNLTPNDIDVLNELEFANHGSSNPEKWVRPMDIGAYNGSYHSNTLNKLAGWGYVQHKQRGAEDPPEGENGKKIWAGRGAKVYRITNIGRLVLEAHRQNKEHSK